MGLLEQEQARLLLLDIKHRLIATVTLYAGAVNACPVRVGEVFREAVRRNATALIVAHNHPSGAVDPSPEDVRVTTEVVQAGRLLDVEVLDHLIRGLGSLREHARTPVGLDGGQIMTTITRDTAPDTVQAPVAVIMESMLAAVQAHLRGEERAPVYLAAGQRGTGAALVLATLGAAAATARAARWGDRLLVGTGGEFAWLWQQALRRGMPPVVRRALATQRIILLDGLEALRDEPVAQWELARVIVPGRLVILAGHGHLRHVAAWSPALAAHLDGAASLCLHDGPCVTDADAWATIDRVAGYDGLTRAQFLSRRRLAHVVLARQVAMHLLRADGLPSMRVGGLLRRDHATVLHGDARIRHLAARQTGVRHDLDTLRRVIAA